MNKNELIIAGVMYDAEIRGTPRHCCLACAYQHPESIRKLTDGLKEIGLDQHTVEMAVRNGIPGSSYGDFKFDPDSEDPTKTFGVCISHANFIRIVAKLLPEQP